MSRFGSKQLFRRVGTAIIATALSVGSLLVAPTPASAAGSTARLITTLNYSRTSNEVEFLNWAGTASKSFASGAGRDSGDTGYGANEDDYRIKLYSSAISLLPTVSDLATWSCSIAKDTDANNSAAKTDGAGHCSITGLENGDIYVITLTVTAEDPSYDNEYNFKVVAISTGATLSDISLSNGDATLSPDFSTSVTDYTAYTGKTTTKIYYVKGDSGSTVTCDAGTLGSDGDGNYCDVDLAGGEDTDVTLRVTPANGGTATDYNVTVTQIEDSNNEIASIALSHGGLLTVDSTDTDFVRANFSPTVDEYDLTSNSDSISVTVTLKDEDARFSCTAGAGLGDFTNQSKTDNDPGQDTCALDLTGADGGPTDWIEIEVFPSNGATGAEDTKVYTFYPWYFSGKTSDLEPAVSPSSDSVRVGTVLSLGNPDDLVGPNFSNVTRVMFQWYLCDTDEAEAEDPDTVPADCVVKPLSIGSTYRTTTTDAGKFVLGALIGQPGSVLAYANATEVLGQPGLIDPTNPPAPSEVVGLAEAKVGTSVTLTNYNPIGDYFTNTASRIYQWYRCTTESKTASVGLTVATPRNCAKISGATSPSYTPVTSTTATLNDVGKYIRARLILRSGGGQEYVVFTRTTNKVFGPAVVTTAPSAPTAPTLTAAAPSKSITAAKGSWSGYPTLNAKSTYSYSWYYCNRRVATAPTSEPINLINGQPRCTKISGASSSTLTVTTEYKGKYLLVGVRVNNSYNGQGALSAWAYSASSSTAVIAP